MNYTPMAAYYGTIGVFLYNFLKNIYMRYK